MHPGNSYPISSRTNLMTGLRPSSTGIYALAQWIRSVPDFKDVVMLPQSLKKHGGYSSYFTDKVYHGGNGQGKRVTRRFFDCGKFMKELGFNLILKVIPT